MAKETPAPGRVKVKFHETYYGLDFTQDGQAERYVEGSEVDVDAALAKKLVLEMGAGCPFKIVSENKALAGADETK